MKPSIISALWSAVKRYKSYTAVFIAVNILLLSRIPLGSFNDSSILDSIAHFVLPASGTPLLYAAFVKSGFLPDMPKLSGLIVIFTFGVTLAVLWEIFELVVDRSFGTDWQLSNKDTMLDLILGGLGALVGGAIFLKAYTRR